MAGEASPKHEHVTKQGYGAAVKEAQFVAAPLLTAAALSLSGVVAGADKAFRWPGAALILLVITSMTLVFSMQLAYNARAYLFTFAELKDHYEGLPRRVASLERMRNEYDKAQDTWENRNYVAVLTYDAGSLLLGLSVAACLVPPDGRDQWPVRWAAAVIVCVGTMADAIWMVRKKW
ncbi:hypothetical protein AB0I69_38045 [Streptomyces sp. NPDC050508]|uniref:hypothetical protein n=1 Tax=Streptomyces sp. NPDC050508 TaxID=3155405 RepID=UPI0034239F51